MLKRIPSFLSILLIFTLSSQIRPISAYESVTHASSDEKTLRLKTLSTITTLAQSAIWLNEKELAVGRWDGTITVFRGEDSLSIQEALIPPTRQGITMLERIDDLTFVSSNGHASIALWEQEAEKHLLKNTYLYNGIFGAADSARFLKIENRQILLTGHSEGYFLVWEFSATGLSLLNSINLRSDRLLDSPYELWNIRSILPWQEGIVVTASEDGDLCMIDILKGKILHRQKYNEEAKRGINHIFISGDYLLLTNCTVGLSDRNLWLYRIEKKRFVYLDSKNLIANEDLDQVYSFDVGSIVDGNSIRIFCSTGEGLLWFGQIENESLAISGFENVSPRGGAAIAIHPLKKRLASVSYDVLLLELSAD